jgi:hypothetical protein
MNNALATLAATGSDSVSVRGVLTRAPKTTYSYAPVDAGWVEIEWCGGVVHKQILVCDRGRGVADYYWGHTYPAISREGLPFRLWCQVADCLKGLNARVGAFEATLEVAGLEAPAMPAAA